jgi:uncharacterized metal-binding protein YceD (DUF177 family)
MAAFALHVPDIDEHVKEHSFAVTRSWLAEAFAGLGDVRAPAEGTADGSLRITAQKVGGKYLVRGAIDATLVTDCYRCLEDVRIDVHAELAVLFRFGPTARSAPVRGGSAIMGPRRDRAVAGLPMGRGGTRSWVADPAPSADLASGARGGGARPAFHVEDLDLDGPDQETFSGETIALDSLVREHLLLEVPMQPLCREDCPGIPIPEHVRGPADAFADARRPRALGDLLGAAGRHLLSGSDAPLPLSRGRGGPGRPGD